MAALGAVAMPALQHLIFEFSEGSDGISALEAMAATRADAHAAVMAEVQQVLDWAGERFAGQHGQVEDGRVWDHEVLVQTEAGGWLTVTLTLTGTPYFVEAVLARYAAEHD